MSPPQRQDQFIHLVRDLLHLALAVVGVHVQAHLACGVAVVAGALDAQADGVGYLGRADFTHRALRSLRPGWAVVALGTLRTRWTAGISLGSHWPRWSGITLRPLALFHWPQLLWALNRWGPSLAQTAQIGTGLCRSLPSLDPPD
jgi:hypothetical protein